MCESGKLRDSERTSDQTQYPKNTLEIIRKKSLFYNSNLAYLDIYKTNQKFVKNPE